MTDRLIYKLLLEDEFATAKAAGVLLGAPIDLEDGFIHLSTASQLQETARLYFTGRGDVYILAVEVERLDADKLVYEKSRGGALFPHYFAPLPMQAVVKTDCVKMDANGHIDVTNIL